MDKPMDEDDETKGEEEHAEAEVDEPRPTITSPLGALWGTGLWSRMFWN